MNTLTSYPNSKENLAECTTCNQVQAFLALGDFMGWRPQVIGQAPMLAEPIRMQEWLLVPAQQDNTELPPRTLRRIKLIYKQGLHPQGFVVVHEAPMQLTAPAPVITEKTPVEWEQVGQFAGSIAKGLGMLLLGSLLLPLGLLVMLDPILIVVTQDNYWIEIDRWQV
jgi:hypothetical protein